MKIVTKSEILTVLRQFDPLLDVESGFVDYSKGLACIPPVSELVLEKGEVHVKCGYLKAGVHYVIKVASGFYGNSVLGLPSSNGLMMLFSTETGEAKCLLQDEGILTDHRTAIAGAIVAKYFAPAVVSAIGVVGTGIQACLQVKRVSQVTGCKKIIVWGRSTEAAERFRRSMQVEGYSVELIEHLESLAEKSNLIITTTPSSRPLLSQKMIQAGTLIIAIGTDTPEKQELDTDILVNATKIIVDSKKQSLTRGEVSRALRASAIGEHQVFELGAEIAKGRRPTMATETTVVDLTGLAVQDLKIAEFVLNRIN